MNESFKVGNCGLISVNKNVLMLDFDYMLYNINHQTCIGNTTQENYTANVFVIVSCFTNLFILSMEGSSTNIIKHLCKKCRNNIILWKIILRLFTSFTCPFKQTIMQTESNYSLML